MFSALSGPFGPTLGAPNTAGGGAAPVITSPSSLVAGTINTLYPTTTFTATGTAPITWTVQSGTLPTGMSFSSGGVLSGTPTVTASGSITFRATNAFGFADRPLTLTVNASGWAPTTLTATVDGAAATLTQVEAITTRSGTWWVDGLGQFGDSYVYAMRYSGDSTFIRLMTMRRSFTNTAGDTSALNTRTIALTATLNGTTTSWTADCVQGSVRVVQNKDPVAPNPAWLREAVTNYKITAFRRENAWNPATFIPESPDAWRSAYNPQSLGPNSSATTPTSNNNYVGVTSAQGGEYVSSRSFIHSVDAGVVDRALHNEDAAITNLWSQFIQYTFYSLSQPQAAVWSTTNHVTADPFFPISAPDRPYTLDNGVTNPTSTIDTLLDVSQWGRDVPHLENTGYVHWLLTEDPVAALVVQRQLAYAIAGYYAYRRGSVTTNYRCYDEQERGVYNCFSALFKNKIITDSISTQNGRWLWSSTRVNKMVTDGISYLDDSVYQPVFNSTISDTINYTRKTIDSYSSLLGGTSAIPAYGGSYDGQQVYRSSAWQLAQYGQEVFYLWAKNGNTTATKWFTSMGRLLSNLMVNVGGARVFITGDATGNMRPIVLASATSPYTTVASWAAFMNAIRPGASTTTFDSAEAHSVGRFGNMMRLARDAGVTGLDSAIAIFDSCKTATTSITNTGEGNMPKNCGGL